MEQLHKAILKEDFIKVLEIFNDFRLETLINDNIIEKLVVKLESKKHFDFLIKLLLKIANYPLSALENELKDGLKILANNR